jgi:CRP-like cAMP-binding protein
MTPARGMSTGIHELAAELDRLASTVSVRKGTSLFQCGDPVSGVFIVRKGAVTLSLDTPNGVYPPKTLRPGEIAGLPATLTGSYSLSARAAEDSVLGFVPSDRVTEFLEEQPRLSLAVTRLMSQEIVSMRNALRSTPPLHEPD